MLLLIPILLLLLLIPILLLLLLIPMLLLLLLLLLLTTLLLLEMLEKTILTWMRKKARLKLPLETNFCLLTKAIVASARPAQVQKYRENRKPLKEIEDRVALDICLLSLLTKGKNLAIVTSARPAQVQKYRENRKPLKEIEDRVTLGASPNQIILHLGNQAEFELLMEMMTTIALATMTIITLMMTVPRYYKTRCPTPYAHLASFQLAHP